MNGHHTKRHVCVLFPHSPLPPTTTHVSHVCLSASRVSAVARRAAVQQHSGVKCAPQPKAKRSRACASLLVEMSSAGYQSVTSNARRHPFCGALARASVIVALVPAQRLDTAYAIYVNCQAFLCAPTPPRTRSLFLSVQSVFAMLCRCVSLGSVHSHMCVLRLFCRRIVARSRAGHVVCDVSRVHLWDTYARARR